MERSSNVHEMTQPFKLNLLVTSAIEQSYDYGTTIVKQMYSNLNI